MFEYLHGLRFTSAEFYQILFETSMFGVPPLYRCALVKWHPDKRREVLIESTDHKQVEAVLTMLISIAEEEKRAGGR